MACRQKGCTMARYAKFSLEGGGDFILVETDENDETGFVSVDNAIHEDASGGSFEQAVSKLRPIIKAVMTQLSDLGPKDIQIELALKFSAGAGVILAKASTEGSCKITVSWKP